MSRFGNQSQLKTSKSVARQQTTNLAGGVAYAISLRSELLTLLVTSFLTDQFYRIASEQSDPKMMESKALAVEI